MLNSKIFKTFITFACSPLREDSPASLKKRILPKILIVTVIINVVLSGCLDYNPKRSNSVAVTVNEGKYFVIELNNTDNIFWELNYLGGESNIDVYTVNKIDFDLYENEDSFHIIPAISTPEIKNASRGPENVEGGTYYWIVDNSEQGAAYPSSDSLNNSVRVSYEITWTWYTASDQ